MTPARPAVSGVACRGFLTFSSRNLPQNVSLEASRSLRVAGASRPVAPIFLNGHPLFAPSALEARKNLPV